MTKQQIGQALKKARGKKTSYQVCRDANITSQQLHAMEESSKNYTIDSLIKLCGVLGMKVEVK
jgi:transcriptional regulator with XRE-family HTH domain